MQPATSITTTGVGLVAALAMAATLDADEVRCTLRLPYFTRSDTEAVLLGSALGDTLHAGAGEVAPRHESHPGWVRARPIFGQLIEIARHAGADSAVLARAFARNRSNHVVVVPWAFDPACEPTPWEESAAWVSPGELGVFTVRLRRQSHWANGVPTFDALRAQFEPYPSAYLLLTRADSLLRSEAITAPEYFDSLRAIPAYKDVRGEPAPATIAGWRTRQRELASRYPATRVLYWLVVAISEMW